MSSNEKSNTGVLLFFFLIAAALIWIFEYVVKASSASLILTLVYFTMLTQGSLAVVASAETALGKWVRPFKRQLLSLSPILWLLPVLFLMMYYKWELYPRHLDPDFWHDRVFFVMRNFGMLIITAILGTAFASASLAEKPTKMRWAILYLIAWVTNMGFVAFDWVMPLEYPWVSTLYGAYFFVESLFMGFCMAALILFAQSRRLSEEDWKKIRTPRQSVALMMFGFSIVWGHEFFSQYLVIWYGNLPEFNSFFVFRLEKFGNFIYIIPALMFAFPFLALLTAKIKFNAAFVMFVAMVVLFAVALERYIIIQPVAPLFASTGGTLLILGEFAILGSLIYWLIARSSNDEQEQSA